MSHGSKLLIDEPPLQVLPSLARKVGLNEAMVLQQIHYWLKSFESAGKKDHFRDGRWWVYNTYDEWKENFPFWSTSTIRRTIGKLERAGYLISQQFDAKSADHTKWYSIDYEVLHGQDGRSEQIDLFKVNRSAEKDKSPVQNEQIDLVKVNRSLNESEINSTDIDPPPPEESKPKSQYVQNMERLEAEFAQARGVRLPDWSNGGAGLNSTWRLPCRHILAQCEGDMDKAIMVIQSVVKEMREDELTFSMPCQIVKNAESFIADMEEPPTTRVRNFTAERLARERQSSA